MDVQNIATHELGHSLSLDDLYNSSIDSLKTMYGYASYGETKKQALEVDDIAGIIHLYPAPSYTVTFNAQGGSVNPASIMVTNGLIYGDLPVPTRTNYTFGGWWTGTNGTGSQVLSTTTVTITSAQTLYAKWTVNYYTLTGSTGINGAVSPVSTNVPAGNSATFVITASNYYRIATLTTNGTAVAGMSFDNNSTSTNFIWSNVQTSGVLAATFTSQVAADPANTPYWWLAGYGLTNYNTDAAADQDFDGLTAWQEYIAGTDPTNGTSSFKVNTFKTAAAEAVIQWSAVTGRVYGVHWATNLLNSFQPLKTNIGWPQASYTDTVHGVESSSFYRVKVQMAQ